MRAELSKCPHFSAIGYESLTHWSAEFSKTGSLHLCKGSSEWASKWVSEFAVHSDNPVHYALLIHGLKTTTQRSWMNAMRKTWNCRNNDLCPLDGKCLTSNVNYEATVTTTSGNPNTCIGMTENDFKTRYKNHKLSFNDRKHSHDTVLSRYIWELWDNDTNYDIKWRIIKKGKRLQRKPFTLQLMHFLRNSVSWLPVMFHLSTKDLNWLPSVVTKTSSSRPIIERAAPNSP